MKGSAGGKGIPPLNIDPAVYLGVEEKTLFIFSLDVQSWQRYTGRG